jgi:hypothetical protein
VRALNLDNTSTGSLSEDWLWLWLGIEDKTSQSDVIRAGAIDYLCTLTAQQEQEEFGRMIVFVYDKAGSSIFFLDVMSFCTNSFTFFVAREDRRN